MHVANADGSGVARLIDHRAEDSYPAWSPEGTHLAFTSCRPSSPEDPDDSDRICDIFVMKADGSGLTNLTNSLSIDLSPSWSPTGATIAFTSAVGFNDIYAVKADGSGLTNLTNSPEGDSGPAWSPDGTRIAFASNRDNPGLGEGEEKAKPGVKGEICVMNADGSNLTCLTRDAAAPPDQYPVWSPDGTRIAFASHRSTGVELVVMNADGSALTPVADNLDGYNFTWSADGTRIAYEGRVPDGSEIYVVNADGSGRTRLTDTPAEDYAPAWQPVP